MQQIIAGEVDNPLFSYAPLLARINRAFIRFQTPDVPMGEPWIAADVDSTAGTTSAESLEGETVLRFSTLPSGVTRNRKYYVLSDDGENFSVTALKSELLGPGNGLVMLADPLPVTVPSGSSFGSYCVTFDLSAADIKTAGAAIARWKVEVRIGLDVIDHIWDDPFLVVNAETNYQLSSGLLVRMYPLVDRLRPPSDEDLTELISTAWSNYIRPDLEGKGLKANQIKSWDRLTPAHAVACVLHLVLTDERQSADFVQQWRNEYAHQMDLMFAGIRFWYSDTDGTTPGKTDENFSGRSISR